MDVTDRQKAINAIREICFEIGCSGIDPKMCKEAPQNCKIIRKLVAPRLTVITTDPP